MLVMSQSHQIHGSPARSVRTGFQSHSNFQYLLVQRRSILSLSLLMLGNVVVENKRSLLMDQ